MPVLKRPASMSKGNSSKRPASSIKDVVTEMKNKASEQDDAEGSDQEDDAGDKRDKGKAEKWHKMLKSGQLAPQLVDMWKHGAKECGKGERSYRTSLINTMMMKQKDGSYAVNTDNHMYKSYRETYHKHVSKDQMKALPRGIMLATHFHGNAQLMQASIDSGELQVCKDDDSGIEFLSFRALKIEDIKGNVSKEQVESTKKVTKGQAMEMEELMKKLKWQFNFTKADEKALEEGSVPKKYGALLNKAKDAVQKLLKQGSFLLKEKQLAHKADDLKKGYRTLTKHATDLENVLTLEDLPDSQKLTKANIDKFIGNVAKDVDLWNGELQGLQGFLKAKK